MGDIHFQHGVAQKFQPFVMNGIVLIGPRTVGQRRSQQRNVVKAILETLLKLRKALQRIGGKSCPVHV